MASNDAAAARKEAAAVEERRAALTAELRQREIMLASADRERADNEVNLERLRGVITERDAAIVRGKEELARMQDIVAEAEKMRAESEIDIDRARKAATAHGETIEKLERLELEMRGREQVTSL